MSGDRREYAVLDFDGFLCNAAWEKLQAWRAAGVRGLTLEYVAAHSTEEIKRELQQRLGSEQYAEVVPRYAAFMDDPRRTFHDKQIKHAGSAVRELVEVGLSIAIVTARLEPLRQGTLHSLYRFGIRLDFADPREPQSVHADHLLYMRRYPTTIDMNAKKEAINDVLRRGSIVLGTGDRPGDVAVYKAFSVPAIVLHDGRYDKSEYSRFRLRGTDSAQRPGVLFIDGLDELPRMAVKVRKRFEPVPQIFHAPSD